MDLDTLRADLDRRTADHTFRGVALVRRRGSWGATQWIEAAFGIGDART